MTVLVEPMDTQPPCERNVSDGFSTMCLTDDMGCDVASATEVVEPPAPSWQELQKSKVSEILSLQRRKPQSSFMAEEDIATLVGESRRSHTKRDNSKENPKTRRKSKRKSLAKLTSLDNEGCTIDNTRRHGDTDSKVRQTRRFSLTSLSDDVSNRSLGASRGSIGGGRRRYPKSKSDRSITSGTSPEDTQPIWSSLASSAEPSSLDKGIDSIDDDISRRKSLTDHKIIPASCYGFARKDTFMAQSESLRNFDKNRSRRTEQQGTGEASPSRRFSLPSLPDDESSRGLVSSSRRSSMVGSRRRYGKSKSLLDSSSRSCMGERSKSDRDLLDSSSRSCMGESQRRYNKSKSDRDLLDSSRRRCMEESQSRYSKSKSDRDLCDSSSSSSRSCMGERSKSDRDLLDSSRRSCMEDSRSRYGKSKSDQDLINLSGRGSMEECHKKYCKIKSDRDLLSSSGRCYDWESHRRYSRSESDRDLLDSTSRSCSGESRKRYGKSKSDRDLLDSSRRSCMEESRSRYSKSKSDRDLLDSSSTNYDWESHRSLATSKINPAIHYGFTRADPARADPVMTQSDHSGRLDKSSSARRERLRKCKKSILDKKDDKSGSTPNENTERHFHIKSFHARHDAARLLSREKTRESGHQESVLDRLNQKVAKKRNGSSDTNPSEATSKSGAHGVILKIAVDGMQSSVGRRLALSRADEKAEEESGPSISQLAKLLSTSDGGAFKRYGTAKRLGQQEPPKKLGAGAKKRSSTPSLKKDRDLSLSRDLKAAEPAVKDVVSPTSVIQTTDPAKFEVGPSPNGNISFVDEQDSDGRNSETTDNRRQQGKKLSKSRMRRSASNPHVQEEKRGANAIDSNLSSSNRAKQRVKTAVTFNEATLTAVAYPPKKSRDLWATPLAAF